MKEKETIRKFIFNERALCDNHTKLSGGSSTGKLKNLCGSPHIEKEVTFNQKKQNMVNRVYDIHDSHK